MDSLWRQMKENDMIIISFIKLILSQHYIIIKNLIKELIINDLKIILLNSMLIVFISLVLPVLYSYSIQSVYILKILSFKNTKIYYD